MEFYTGEIRMFAGYFAPEGWMLCDGSKVKISDFPALYSLIGVAYGGDGISDFALPDLRGRIPIGSGQGLNLPNVKLAEAAGVERVNITIENYPPHNHAVNAVNATGTTSNPVNGFLATPATAGKNVYMPGTPAPETTPMAADSLNGFGYNIPSQSIMQPYLVINYIIGMNGLYPTE